MAIKKNVTKKVCNIFNCMFFLIVISFFLVLPAYGQQTESLLCKEVESKVIVALKPAKMWRTLLTEDECVFEFSNFDKRKIAIYIEKYESEAKSSEDLGRSVKLFTVYDDTENPPKRRYKIINKDKYWNEAIAYKNAKPDHFILLRYRIYMITILSSDFGVLKKTEMLLRNIRFENF